MEKKYQVFVSSTYEDLKEERKEATQALLESNCIPAGMELFPASNSQQWDIIKKVIDDCDFYMLIVAGRYGTLSPVEKRISYTEMEFNYAMSVKKPIIVFIHSQIDSLAASKVEQTKLGKNRLNKFINKAKSGRMIKEWDNKDNLKSVILNGIRTLIENENAVGWVRGDKIIEASNTIQELLVALAEAEKTIATLTTKIGAYTLTPGDIGAATVTSGKATLAISGWTGTAAPYIYELPLPGITADDVLDIMDLEGTDKAAANLIQTAWGMATGYHRPQTSDGKVTFYASEKPSINIPIQWRLIK